MAEIRYHLDEHMDTAIAVGLRRRGIDVATTIEAGLLRASDPKQIAFATDLRDSELIGISADRTT